MKKIISRCPVCGGELVVTRLKCNSCETVIENKERGDFKSAGKGRAYSRRSNRKIEMIQKEWFYG